MVNLGEPELLFRRFEQGALTTGGARAEFELFVLDLVKVQHPTANTIKGKGGNDWGIDTLVGNLSQGRLAIWQCKFFLKWDDSKPQQQVRDSFKSAFKHGNDNRYTIASWTLCVPGVLSGDQQLWFDRWAARKKRETGVDIKLWNGYDLRHRLLQEDNREVRAEYFPDTLAPREVAAIVRPIHDIAEIDDPSRFDDALFVRQLVEAGEVETDIARGLYYATDALVRDYEAKADSSAIAALKDLHMDAHRLWTQRFNAEHSTANTDGRIPGLHGRVMSDMETRPDPVGMPMQLRGAHKMGAVHRLVEDEKAGWVTHWRQVASAHRSERTATGTILAEETVAAAQKAATVGVSVADGASQLLEGGEG